MSPKVASTNNELQKTKIAVFKRNRSHSNQIYMAAQLSQRLNMTLILTIINNKKKL
jgi:hypothetical protein